jgi:hypothetical protein
MTSSLEAEIRVRLCQYLAGNLSLTQLEDWLVPATWDVQRGYDPAT